MLLTQVQTKRGQLVLAGKDVDTSVEKPVTKTVAIAALLQVSLRAALKTVEKKNPPIPVRTECRFSVVSPWGLLMRHIHTQTVLNNFRIPLGNYFQRTAASAATN